MSKSRLSERAMLVDFTCNKWRAKRKDQQVSDEIARLHNTTKKAGNYNKNLLPFDAPSYEAIGAIVSKARAFHRENTSPWSDGDLRILTTANFMEYNTKMKEFRAEFEAAVDTFIPDALRVDDQNPGLFQLAQQKLNGLWKAEDYPNAARLRARHNFEWKRWPMPEVEDFRAQVGDDEVAEIRDEMTVSRDKVIADAMRELWNLLYESVDHFFAVMSDQSAKVTSALFDNMTALCDRLPRLNIEDDPNLTRMAGEVKTRLASFSPKYVGGKSNKRNRKQVADQAEAIRKQMAAYFPTR